jgi:hypothetical protein
MKLHFPRVLFLIAGVALRAALPSQLHGQANPPPDCSASQAAAVQCLVANAVSTGLTQPRYGMTLAQLEEYGVAVTKILQTDQT